MIADVGDNRRAAVAARGALTGSGDNPHATGSIETPH
jgi:hypothetical protein